MKPLRFTKMHGLGNDFIMIDAINQCVNLSKQQICHMADRHFGIGYDQLLLVEKSEHKNADFKYRIFNADGGEVEQCGNGARCFALFVHEKGLTQSNPVVVETATGIITLYLEKDKVRVDMGTPQFSPQSLPFEPPQSFGIEDNLYHLSLSQLQIEQENADVNFSAVSVGNPHITIIVNDIDNYPVTQVGKILESHTCFPNRVNVGFMQIIAADHVRLRVFERGTGETMACGSGACAAVVNGISRDLLTSPVKVDLHGGTLDISWNGPEKPVWMTGSASFVYEGQINL